MSPLNITQPLGIWSIMATIRWCPIFPKMDIYQSLHKVALRDFWDFWLAPFPEVASTWQARQAQQAQPRHYIADMQRFGMVNQAKAQKNSCSRCGGSWNWSHTRNPSNHFMMIHQTSLLYCVLLLCFLCQYIYIMNKIKIKIYNNIYIVISPSPSPRAYVCVYIHIHVHIYIYVCVCIWCVYIYIYLVNVGTSSPLSPPSWHGPSPLFSRLALGLSSHQLFCLRHGCLILAVGPTVGHDLIGDVPWSFGCWTKNSPQEKIFQKCSA